MTKTQDLLIRPEVALALLETADACTTRTGPNPEDVTFDEARWRRACYDLGLPVDDLFGYLTRLVVVQDGPPRIRRDPKDSG